MNTPGEKAENADQEPVSQPSPQKTEHSFDEHIIDSILPARELHLIGGPSGAGKTTWLVDMIENWRQGRPIFGHASHPHKFGYLSLDRSANGMKRTFSRMKVDFQRFPFAVVPRAQQKDPLIQILQKYAKKNPDVRVLFIEGLASKVPNGKLNDYAVVADFLISLGQFCEDHNVTLIGVVHSAKTKAEDKYDDPRQRIMGSVAWAAYSETIILVEPADPDDATNQVRTLTLLPRNARPEVYHFEFRDGLLVRRDGVRLTNTQKIIAFLHTLKPNDAGLTLVTTEQVKAALPEIPKGSLDNELSRLTNPGSGGVNLKSPILERVKPGTYRVNLPKSATS